MQWRENNKINTNTTLVLPKSIILHTYQEKYNIIQHL